LKSNQQRQSEITGAFALEAKMTHDEAKLTQSAADFTADLAALRQDIAKISASLVDLMQDKAASKVSEVVDDARHKLADKAAEAQERVGAIGADLESTIERNPLIAVLLAAFAGFVIGMLSRPRK
jgi:ElaB/YqjD/DUF883 family membrane-anchored ribosome-binding protein